MKDLTPIAITQREFQRRFRGLDPVEVRTFLDGVAEELQRLLKENASKEERIQKQEAQLYHYQARERELKEALLAVQRMAEETREKARKEADLILKDAEVKAERLLERTNLMLAQIQGRLADLKRQKMLFEGRIRSAIKLHQDLLATETTEESSGLLEPKTQDTGT